MTLHAIGIGRRHRRRLAGSLPPVPYYTCRGDIPHVELFGGLNTTVPLAFYMDSPQAASRVMGRGLKVLG